MTRYASLWACFTSGQMSHAALEAHCRDDAVFAVWVRDKAKTPRVGATHDG